MPSDHRIHVAFPIPARVAIAFSGGVDSVAVVDFLSRSNRDITLLHFNHGTPHAKEAETFACTVAAEYGLEIRVGYLDGQPPSGSSKEDYWRNARYGWLLEAASGVPVITCHHLDDAVETWLFTSLKGRPSLPRLRWDDDLVIRPFLMTTKKALDGWAERRGLEHVEDPSNGDTSYDRNYIRHELMPHALRVNPGLHTTVYKMLSQRVE